MAPDELKALLERVGAGEEAACRALYLRYRPSVSRLLEGFAQLDDDEREDLVQETFTRAFRAVKGVKAAEAFEGWLLTIARNRALSALSRKSTQRELKERLSTEQSEETGFIPEALQLELEVDVVRKLIDALPEGPEKETVRLFYVEGELSAREIAERLDVGKSAVTMRLERFRAKVRRELMLAVLKRRWTP